MDTCSLNQAKTKGSPKPSYVLATDPTRTIKFGVSNVSVADMGNVSLAVFRAEVPFKK
jgi:hypothetical protein